MKRADSRHLRLGFSWSPSKGPRAGAQPPYLLAYGTCFPTEYYSEDIHHVVIPVQYGVLT